MNKVKVIFRNIKRMVCNRVERGRKGITVTVVLLGCALFTVLFSYMVFGDTNDHEGLRTLRMVGIVRRIFFLFNFLNFLFTLTN